MGFHRVSGSQQQCGEHPIIYAAELPVCFRFSAVCSGLHGDELQLCVQDPLSSETVELSRVQPRSYSEILLTSLYINVWFQQRFYSEIMLASLYFYVQLLIHSYSEIMLTSIYFNVWFQPRFYSEILLTSLYSNVWFQPRFYSGILLTCLSFLFRCLVEATLLF